MKPVPPTLREKKRYIAFKVYTAHDIDKGDIVRATLDEGLSFFGEKGVSRFAIWVLDYDPSTKKGFLICNLTQKDEVLALLTLIDRVGGRKACFQVLGVSGTIHALKRKFLKDD